MATPEEIEQWLAPADRAGGQARRPGFFEQLAMVAEGGLTPEAAAQLIAEGRSLDERWRAFEAMASSPRIELIGPFGDRPKPIVVIEEPRRRR